MYVVRQSNSTPFTRSVPFCARLVSLSLSSSPTADLGLPSFSEPDPNSESRPPSPYGERDPRQPQNNLYNWSPPRGALWSVLHLPVLLLNTLRGSYHSQLANAVPPLPSTAVASQHLPLCCRPTPCSSTTFISHIPHCPELPRSHRTFATCAGADLINSSATACLQIVTSLRQRPPNTRLNRWRRTRWTCHRGELERSGFATKLSENRLACCLHTIYYKRLYILLYMRRIYKYMECSTVFYYRHEVNMHEACGRVKGCDRV